MRKINPVEFREKLIKQVKLLKALNKVDDRGYVILGKKQRHYKWICCRSCKKTEGIRRPLTNDNVGAVCSVLVPNHKDHLNVIWPGDLPDSSGWICLQHKFS